MKMTKIVSPTCRAQLCSKRISHIQSISIEHGKCRDLWDTQDILGTQRKEMELSLGLVERRTDLSFQA